MVFIVAHSGNNLSLNAVPSSYEQSVPNVLRVQVGIGELEVTMKIDRVVLRSRKQVRRTKVTS